MTKLEAVKHGLAVNERNFKYGLKELSIIMEKAGEYLAGSWDEKKYAESCGWNYVDTIANLAREYNLI